MVTIETQFLMMMNDLKYSSRQSRRPISDEKFNKLSPDAKNWFVGAIDPFHDVAYQPTGMPDQYCGMTLVQVVKRSVTITAPPGIGTGFWDCHVTTLPFMEAEPVHPAQTTTFRVHPIATQNALSVGTVTAFTMPAGTASDPQSFAAIYGSAATGQIYSVSPTDPSYDTGRRRIVGGGFEVHNTTADLYTSGSVTVYSRDQVRGQCLMNCTDTIIEVGGVPRIVSAPYTVERATLYPVSIDEANQDPRSLSWSAKDGAYVPFRLDLERSQLVPHMRSRMLLRAQDSAVTAVTEEASLPDSLLTGSPAYDSTEMLSGGTPTPSGLTDGGAFVYSHYATACGLTFSQTAGLHLTGAYFTGLTPQTVLTLNVRFLVESVPDINNVMLTSLSRRSTLYDPRALQLYDMVVCSLPPGCKVADNASGDWWRAIYKVAESTITSMFPMAKIPIEVVKGLVSAAMDKPKAIESSTQKKPKTPATTLAVNRKAPPLVKVRAPKRN